MQRRDASTRVDRGLGYVMYGDLQTASFSPFVQELGAYNRALTGVQQHFENSRTMVNLFASHDSLRQVIDEFAALGISGPYPVSNPSGVSGTERVEIITRDRNQPALVLSALRLTRFSDYEFEPFSGRLLFRRPIGFDERLNPVSIRATYERRRRDNRVGGGTRRCGLAGAADGRQLDRGFVARIAVPPAQPEHDAAAGRVLDHRGRRGAVHRHNLGRWRRAANAPDSGR
jgi:hypothetical protein